MKREAIRRTAGALSLAMALTATTSRADEGDLDATFGQGGVVPIAFGVDDELLRGVAIRDDGELIAVGEGASSGPEVDASVIRSTTAGVWEWGDLEDASTEDDRAWDVAIQSDGKIVTAGCSHLGIGGLAFFLLRYGTDGMLDPSFDLDGRVVGPWCFRDVAIQPDGRIVAVGGYDTLLVRRFEPDGSPDATFSGDGVDSLDLGSGFEELFGVALQPDGKIVAVGCVETDTVENTVILRYDTDGTLDSTFDGVGWVMDNVSTGDDCFRSVAVQSDGRLVAVGSAFDDLQSLVVRYNANGSRDTSFSDDGADRRDHGLGDDILWDVALQEDGRIVAAGELFLDDANEAFVTRYEPDGALDTTFGPPDGWVHDKFFGGASGGRGVAIQEDGQIVVSGYGSDSFGKLGALARYHGPGHVFADGFETGDSSGWSGP